MSEPIVVRHQVVLENARREVLAGPVLKNFMLVDREHLGLHSMGEVLIKIPPEVDQNEIAFMSIYTLDEYGRKLIATLDPHTLERLD